MPRAALTRAAGFPYSQHMEMDLDGLEDRVTQLVALCRRLRTENGSLRQQLVVAQNENKRLNERIDAAKARVDALIERVPSPTSAGRRGDDE